MDNHPGWVIEGCYTDLLAMAAPKSNEIIWLNLEVSQCIENARRRSWEPHKYESKAAQDQNLAMLIAWIEQYPKRNNVFSYSAHLSFYEQYQGQKRMVTSLKNTFE